MTLSVRRTLIAAIALLLTVPGVALPAGPAGKGVLVATIAAPIGPVSADYLAAVIERAVGEDAALLVVELDTPGGLDSAMRQIRSEERRVGKECVRLCRSRWSPYH